MSTCIFSSNYCCGKKMKNEVFLYTYKTAWGFVHPQPFSTCPRLSRGADRGRPGDECLTQYTGGTHTVVPTRTRRMEEAVINWPLIDVTVRASWCDYVERLTDRLSNGDLLQPLRWWPLGASSTQAALTPGGLHVHARDSWVLEWLDVRPPLVWCRDWKSNLCLTVSPSYVLHRSRN